MVRGIALIITLALATPAFGQPKFFFEDRADVQKHLGLTESQKNAIRKAKADYLEMLDRIGRQAVEKAKQENLPAQAIEVPVTSYLEAVKKVLTPAQRKRDFEIRLQLEGYEALRREDVQQKLQLSAEHVFLLKTEGFAADMQRKRLMQQQIQAPAIEQLPHDERQRRVESLNEEHRRWQRKLYGRLLGPKLKAFDALMGEPFQFQDPQGDKKKQVMKPGKAGGF
jgi:hypothetical protein